MTRPSEHDSETTERLKEILHRISGVNFYQFIRDELEMPADEITRLKFLSLSKEEKYQIVCESEKVGKKTPQEIYRIVNDLKEWYNYVQRNVFNIDSLKFSGSKICDGFKERILRQWISRRNAETDEQADESSMSELHWIVDDYLSEQGIINGDCAQSNLMWERVHDSHSWDVGVVGPESRREQKCRWNP